MKNVRLFAKIVYFVFTFAVGIVLALFLPYILLIDKTDVIKMVGDELDKGNCVEAISLVGGYYDQQPVLKEELPDGGGIVLFSAATFVPAPKAEEGQAQKGDKFHKAYTGFLYGVTNTYKVYATEDNQTKLVLTDSGGAHELALLDMDTNSDKTPDNIATFYQRGLIFLDFGQDEFDSVQKITFLDKDGNTFYEKSLNLTYGEQFFTDVDQIIIDYNIYVEELYAGHTSNKDQMEANLQSLEDTLLAKSSNYHRSAGLNETLIKSKCDRNAAIIVVCYFIGVYIVADFLLGYHFIIKFFRWFLYKVCKIKPKRKQRIPKEEAFGHDYYSQVTMTLDTSSIENFQESVQVRYNNDEGEISFILLKQDNYTSTQRIKAGVYVNMWIDIDHAFAPVNLPETLVVEGYRKEFTIKIIKREE